MSRFELFVVAWAIVGGLIVLYLVSGFVGDVVAKRRARSRERVVEAISVVLFEQDAEAEERHRDVGELPRRMLLSVLQGLAVDLDGDAQKRLRQLVRTTGLEKFIRRRERARRWRLRVQAAQLHHLISDPNFDRSRLLTDRHRLVRARAAETLTAAQAAHHLDLLIPMLCVDDIVVRSAAQQAVLTAGGASVDRLIAMLEADSSNVVAALEVVANLPDPRFLPVLRSQCSNADSRARVLTAQALGNGSTSSVEVLLEFLTDESEDVRATAIESLARLDALSAVTAIGSCLGDESFSVRRSAGQALDALGAPGRLVLRRQLDSDDRFAADMARQVLDSASARLGVNLLPVSDDVLLDLDEPDAYADVAAAPAVNLADYHPDQIRSIVHAEANVGLGAVEPTGGSGPLTQSEMATAMFFAITASDVIDALLAPAEASSP